MTGGGMPMRPEERGVTRSGDHVTLDDVDVVATEDWLRDLVSRGLILDWTSSEGPFGPRYAIETVHGWDHVTHGIMGAYLRGVEIGAVMERQRGR